MDILRVEEISKVYKERRVVDGASFSIKAAEIVGLLGPNGAGKTTSFYMALGLISVSKGRIFLNEEDITSLKVHERARRGIGYLPQEASIFRKLTVYNNLMAILELRGDLDREARERSCEALLDEFKIGHLRESMGFSLSGGERRRVEVARALALDPKFILLDEPFAGVDPLSILDIKQIIQRLQQRGLGVLITDHNVREALDICSKAYIIHEGKIIAAGSAEEVLQNADVRKFYLGEGFSINNN